MRRSHRSNLPFLRPRGTQHIGRAGQIATTHDATLAESAWCGRALRVMTFRCPAVSQHWRAGDRVLIRVANGLRRAYTISAVDLGRGTFELIAVAHDRGPGGRWVAQTLEGESVRVFGPKPDLDPHTKGADRIVLLGDETTLGLFKAVSRCAVRTIELCGALESGIHPAFRSEFEFAAKLTVYDRDTHRPGAKLHQWVADRLPRGPRTAYFVSGHGAAVRSLRLTLLAAGIPGAAIRSRAYWGRA